ncbi:hypothetical protein LH433_09575, partial [Laribacter hongkongensis]|uniref:hypothetical protein n=1 Tax=Laribacter hongkongensis TaxID=168471 RepID=UPI001EFE80D0
NTNEHGFLSHLKPCLQGCPLGHQEGTFRSALGGPVVMALMQPIRHICKKCVTAHDEAMKKADKISVST